MTSRFLKPDKAKSFNNSQPNPPAPTTKIRAYSCKSSLNCNKNNCKKEKVKKTKLQAHRLLKCRNEKFGREAVYFCAGFESGAHEIAGSE